MIVGMGSVGQRHARNLRALLGDRVCLIAYRATGQSPVIVDHWQADTTRTIEDAYQLQSFASLDDALATKPNVAFICNPTSLHLATAITCADAGCDLFIEKPVAESIQGLDRLADTVRTKGLVVAIGCQLRFHPALELLKKKIGDGSIGRVLAVRAEVGEYLPGWHPYEDYRHSYAARGSLGGGVILTLIHEIDYLTWIFGAPRRLFAVGGHLSSLEVDVEDVASILSECSISGRGVPIHLQMDYVRSPSRRTCSVLGDTGSLDVDLRRNCLTLTNADEGTTSLFEDPVFDRNALFLAELTDFLSARSTRTLPRVTLEDGITALRVALAARESLRSGTLVEIA